MMPVEIVSLAQEELFEEIAYYEAQRLTAGVALREDVLAALEQLKKFPGPGRADPNDPTIHRLVTNRFRFVIHYEILDDCVRVWAISHPARLPGHWSGRRSN